MESIKRQDSPENKIETEVIDNNSSDRTKEIAEKYGVKVFDKGPERSAQRNHGMKMAVGKYLMYLDADMILSPTVIKKSIEKLEEGDLVALYISEIVLGNSYWSRVRRFERSFYDGTVIDCARVIRKDIFERVGGFDLQMTGPEDWDLDKKIREIGRVSVLDEYNFKEIDDKLQQLDYTGSNLVEKLTGLSSKALLYHNEARFNIKRYFQKKCYYAKSFDTYIQKWGKDDLDIKKQFSFSYRYFGVFLEKGKWRKAFSFPILLAGVYCLRILVGISFVLRKKVGKNTGQ